MKKTLDTLLDEIHAALAKARTRPVRRRQKRLWLGRFEHAAAERHQRRHRGRRAPHQRGRT